MPLGKKINCTTIRKSEIFAKFQNSSTDEFEPTSIMFVQNQKNLKNLEKEKAEI